MRRGMRRSMRRMVVVVMVVMGATFWKLAMSVGSTMVARRRMV